MRPFRKAICAGLIVSMGFVLGGCDSLDSIADLAVFDTKKKLPGERKPVFPEGVPGVSQGIPAELQKGYSEQAAQPAPDAAEAAVEQLTAEPRAKEKPKPRAAKPRPRPNAAAQAQPSAGRNAPMQIQPAAQARAPWPDPQPAPPPSAAR